MDDMPVLAVYDDQNYDLSWERHVRHAVRSIIVRDGRAAMVKSRTKGFYQFPGGGIDPGESHEHALVRETLEETGLDVIPGSIRPFGVTREIRASQFVDRVIFDHTSHYYLADVADGVHEQVLEDYEKDLGYTLEWVKLEKARAVNLKLCRTRRYKSKFVLREAEILTRLIEAGAAPAVDKRPEAL